MAGQLKRLAGPAYISNAAANIYTPPAATIYTVIRHIHIANRGASTATFTLGVGATTGTIAAGEEIFKDVPILVAGYFDWYGNLKAGPSATADFLVGIASLASHLVITVMGEQHVA